MNKQFNYPYIYRHPYYDRYFSQIMRHLLSFFVAKLRNIRHVHTPFNRPKYPKGHENEDINEFFEQIFKTNMLLDIVQTDDNTFVHNLFLNKQIHSLPDQELAKLHDINDIFNDNHLELLRSAYKLEAHSQSYNSSVNNETNVKNVCIHIRRGDVQTYSGTYTPTDFFIKTIQHIQSVFNKNKTKYKIHVYSDSVLDLPFQDIIYHVDEDLLKTIHDIICSDVFVMSIGSNVSHFGCLLNKGIVYLDESKLVECFNNKYNIYWSKFKNITIKESDFVQKLSFI